MENILMDHTRWQRIDDVFGQALDVPSEHREAFLDEACGGDQELRRAVERLLAADNAAAD